MTKVPIIHLFSVNLLQMVIMIIQCSCPYNFPRLPQFGFSFSWLEMPNRKTSIRCKKCSSVQWPFGERMHLLFPFDILTNGCKSLQRIPLNGLLYSRKFWMFEFRAVAFFDFEWHAIWWRRPLRWWNVASQAGSWRRSRIFKLLSHVFAQRVGRWDISTTHFYHHHHHHHLVIHVITTMRKLLEASKIMWLTLNFFLQLLQLWSNEALRLFCNVVKQIESSVLTPPQ